LNKIKDKSILEIKKEDPKPKIKTEIESKTIKMEAFA